MARKVNEVRIHQRGAGYQAVACWKNERLRPQFATMDEAIVWAKEQESRMARGLNLEPPVGAANRPAGRAMTLGQLLQHTKERRWNTSGPGGGPIVSAASRIIEAQKAIEALGGDKVRVSSLTYLTIEEKLTKFQEERGNAVGTTNRRKSALLVMLKEAVKLEVIHRLPVIERKPETYRRSFRITPPLEKAMLEWALADGRAFYDYLVLSLYLGARENQILRTRLSETTAFPFDPYVEDGMVVFPPGQVANKHTQITMVPMRPIVEEVVNRHRAASSDPVARILAGRTRRWVNYRFDKMKATLLDHVDVLSQQREGLSVGTDFSPHILRHEFCSRLGDAGFDIHEIQRFSGHATAAMCARYVRPSKVAARLKALRTPGAVVGEGLPGGDLVDFAPTIPVLRVVTSDVAPAPASDGDTEAVTALIRAIHAAGIGHLLEAAMSGRKSITI